MNKVTKLLSCAAKRSVKLSREPGLFKYVVKYHGVGVTVTDNEKIAKEQTRMWRRAAEKKLLDAIKILQKSGLKVFLKNK